MSSKLVRKLLAQTAAPLPRGDGGGGSGGGSTQSKSRKRKGATASSGAAVQLSKEEAMQEHVASILRLDGLVQHHSSATAQKSFDRRSSELKKQQKERKRAKKQAALSNSRGSGSAFAQKPHEKTYNKEQAKRQREEGYFGDLARALRKAKKKNKKDEK